MLIKQVLKMLTIKGTKTLEKLLLKTIDNVKDARLEKLNAAMEATNAKADALSGRILCLNRKLKKYQSEVDDLTRDRQ